MEPHIKDIATELLDIAYEMGGLDDGARVLLLHGWPDDVHAWRKIASSLEEAGFRWAAPWLRGFGPTCFRSAQTVRDGAGMAIAADAFDLADALDWGRFSVVGHDWGDRAAYIMAALAIGYTPRAQFTVSSFAQARRWWYQWLVTVDGGAKAVRSDPVGFARIQWETWTPPGWFDDAEFAATAATFLNADWAEITLNGYRSRCQSEVLDERYGDLRKSLGPSRSFMFRC